MVRSHRCTDPLLPETAEEVWNKPQYPQILLHLHCGEHPDQLYHHLVWKQHRWQPQSFAKGRVNCPPHCWRWASSLQDIYTRRCIRKARRIIKDSSHPSHSLHYLLPSGRRLRSIRSHTSWLKDSFFQKTAFFHLRNIAKLRNMLSVSDAEKLVPYLSVTTSYVVTT